jgi:hypothetical protein
VRPPTELSCLNTLGNIVVDGEVFFRQQRGKHNTAIYVDDSGDEQHDLLTVLCFPVRDRASCLGASKKYRIRLSKKIGFPLGGEFHSVNFLRRFRHLCPLAPS